MKIIRDDQQSTFTFVPVEKGEAETLSAIIALLKPEDKLSYGGRSGGENGETLLINLHAGSTKESQTTIIGSVTFNQQVHVGGVKLALSGSSEEDRYEVGRIRNACYFGSSGLIFLGATEVDGVKAIITTAMRCSLCDGNMIDFGECEWKTCKNCRDKCEHTYISGAVHGGDAGDLGVGEFCEKCGRGKPRAEGERKKSQLEQHRAAERELGITVQYPDSHVGNPSQAAQFARFVRRYRKAKKRQRSAQA